MKGIYVIHLPEMEKNIYKIGCSKNIKSRILLFNNDTLRLYPVELIYAKEFQNYREAEKEIHKKLKRYRIKSNKEFFKCDLNTILHVINSIHITSKQSVDKDYYFIYDNILNMNNLSELNSKLRIYEILNEFVNSGYLLLKKINTISDPIEKLKYKLLLSEFKRILSNNNLNIYLNLIKPDL